MHDAPCRSTQTSTSGGSSDTEVNEFAVMPCGCSPPTVTTVTPVANVRHHAPQQPGVGRRRSATASGQLAVRRHGQPPVAVPLRRRGLRGRVNGASACAQRLRHPGRHGARVRPAHAGDPLPAPGDQGLARRPVAAARSRSRTRSGSGPARSSRIRTDSSSNAVISAKNSQSTFSVNSFRSSRSRRAPPAPAP